MQRNGHFFFKIETEKKKAINQGNTLSHIIKSALVFHLSVCSYIHPAEMIFKTIYKIILNESVISKKSVRILWKKIK